MAKRKAVRKRHRVRVRPRWVEMARGHDGLLRGHPEPVCVAAAWLVAGDEPTFLGRAVWRVPPLTGRFPLRVDFPDDAAASGAMMSPAASPPGARVAILVVALEEDAGTGVTTAYATLGAPDALRLWRADSRVPDPLSIGALARSLDPDDELAAPVSLLTDHGDLASRIDGDDYLAAALITRPLGPKQRSDLRFHFVTDDNDWTLVVDVRAD